MPRAPMKIPVPIQPAPGFWSVAMSVPLSSGGMSVPRTAERPMEMAYVRE